MRKFNGFTLPKGTLVVTKPCLVNEAGNIVKDFNDYGEVEDYLSKVQDYVQKKETTSDKEDEV